jgi:hypothetical protein
MLYKNKHAKKRKDVSLAQEDEEQRRKRRINSLGRPLRHV